MKHIFPFLAIACLFLCSCREKAHPIEGKTSYTLISKVNFGFLGYSLDCTIYEYNADDIVMDSNIVAEPEYMHEYLFYPNDSIDHLKLKLISSEGTIRWANQIFYLEKGKNIELVAGMSLITNENAYCFNEPKP